LDSTIYFHVGRGVGELILQSKDNEDTHIRIIQRTSYQVTQHQVRNTTMMINCKGQLSLSIEVLEPLPDEIITSNITTERYPRRIPEAARNCKIAMLRDIKMSTNEIRKRLIFIDIECATGLERQPLPISIAMINYDGKILLNKLICPRAYVDRYNESIHGLVEKDLIGKEDALDIQAKVKEMLRGRIIVGFDLHMEHVALEIDLEQIAGIRDLQSCKALSRIMNEERKSWSLSDVARTLRLQSQSRYHSALEDTQLIRQIYKIIEKDWTDTPEEEIQALYFRKIKEGSTPTRSRLMYFTQIRKETEVEQIAKRAESGCEEERVILSDAKRRKEEICGPCCSNANDVTLSPHVSIDDCEEQWVTPPNSPDPMEISTPQASIVEKETLPQTKTLDVSSQDEVMKIQITTKNMTWTITGSNLNLTCTPSDNN